MSDRIGVLFGWTLATIAFFVPDTYQLLLVALAIIIAYLIPGYILRSKINTMLKDLDPLLHNQLRLKIVSSLMSVEYVTLLLAFPPERFGANLRDILTRYCQLRFVL